MREIDSGEEDLKLTDNSGKRLYLFLLDGRPVTDSSGVPLRNIVGSSFISLNVTGETSYYQDWKGFLLTDSRGKSYSDRDYCPTKPPVSVSKTNLKCHTQMFSLDGLPLTDSLGVPLFNIKGKILIVFNPKGHPVMDLDNRDITDRCGRILFHDEKPFMSNNKVPLRIYDELGRPLTDDKGFPFSNLIGHSLIVTDELRNPINTLKGYPIKDAEGNLQWEPGFDLTRLPKYYKMNKAVVCKNNEPGIAFDMYGHPLTDLNGFPLFDLNGALLMKKKKVWLDSNCNTVTIIHKSISDKDEVVRLRNSRGTPVRLYDRRGYPLTDHEGAPLMHANGLILLMFNELGEPIADWKNDLIFDDMGNPLGTKHFFPCQVSNHNESIANHKKYGTQFYDATGMPITNRSGVPLHNRYHDLMAVYDDNGNLVKDLRGRDVYDILGLPTVISFNKPLLDPTGYPIRLFSKSGKPLTDRCGNILKSVKNEYLLKKDIFGRIVSDYKGGPLYDSQGYPMSLVDKFLSIKCLPDSNSKLLINLDGNPLCLYDIAGEPLTDSRGGILMDSSGKNLVTCSPSGIITEKNGQPAYDLEGRTAVKVAGRAVTAGIAVFDIHDRPLIGPSGYILRLRTGKELVKFDQAGFPVCTFDGKAIFDCSGYPVFTPQSDISKVPDFEKKLIFNGKFQLFACDERPLLDITGVILVTSRGIPLLQCDKENMPKSDYIGRPVYDIRGIPVSNPAGIWKDQNQCPYRLFDREGIPLTDSRGKELLDINGFALIKRGEYGHPKYDRLGNVIYDSRGNKITDSNFLGTTVPIERYTRLLMEAPNKPLRVYDLDGRPLTDEFGKILGTVKGMPLLDISAGLNKIVDLSRRTVYDERRIPLACDQTIPITTMKGTPMVLYNKSGNPLMSLDGLPIICRDRSSLLIFDKFGRPSKAFDSGLYDANGVSIDSPDCNLNGVPSQQISLMSMEGRTVRIYSDDGLPITDLKGNILFRSDGDPLRAGSWGDHPG